MTAVKKPAPLKYEPIKIVAPEPVREDEANFNLRVQQEQQLRHQAAKSNKT